MVGVMRIGLVSVLLGLSSLPAGAAPASLACLATGAETVEVATVEDRLELRLVDGRMLRLVGLDPALQTPHDPDLEDSGRKRLGTMIAGRPLAVAILSATPDRWGRFSALAFVTGDPKKAKQAGGLAATAIAAGLGRYLAEPAAHACRSTFLAAEGKARAAKLGLWSDPYYAILAVDDRSAFVERSATVVLVEGRLIGAAAGPYRTKLRFAAPDPAQTRGTLLTAVVLPRTMKTFAARNWNFAALRGRTLRLRGLLDLRFGPQIELTGPDQIEVLPAANEAPATAPSP